MKLLGGNKTAAESTLKGWYALLGGNLGDLEQALEYSLRKSHAQFMTSLGRYYDESCEVLRDVNNKTIEAILLKVVESGPLGYEGVTEEETEFLESLLRGNPDSTILRRRRRKVVMHRMAHVKHLLSAKKDDPLMKFYLGNLLPCPKAAPMIKKTSSTEITLCVFYSTSLTSCILFIRREWYCY